MSYHDHDEQETLENLKAWWGRWGNALTWVLLIVLVVVAGWNGWNYWLRKQSAQAAVLYDQVQQAAAAKDKAKITRVASDMENRFGRTAYAQMTALIAAKVLYDASDAAGAKAQLQWVIEHAQDDAYKEIARVRLAGVLLDEKAYGAGLALLPDNPPKAFQSLFAERRGDLLAAQGKSDEARQAYQAALQSLAANDVRERQLIQFKLDALSG